MNERTRSHALHVAAVLDADANTLEAYRVLQIDTLPCLGPGEGKPCPTDALIPIKPGRTVALCQSCQISRHTAPAGAPDVRPPPASAPASQPGAAFL